jgi:hypothetical protein
MNKQKTIGLIRHLLTFAGGLAVANGLVNDDIVIELTGAIVAVIGGIWSILSPEKQ